MQNQSEVESLVETVEIMSDENLMKQIRESESDVKEEKVREIKSTDDLRRLFWRMLSGDCMDKIIEKEGDMYQIRGDKRWR
jgi:hypothetical protein